MTKAGFVTYYLEGEGRPYMDRCIATTFEFCAEQGIKTIIMFTGSGEGPLHALQHYLTLPAYSAFKVVAVTPPEGRPYRAKPTDQQSKPVRAGVLNPAMLSALHGGGIAIVPAHLPFAPIQSPVPTGSPWPVLGEAFGIFGGGLSLCVQAILMACDAGKVYVGERVAALTADTAISAVASRTESFLSPKEGLLLEHIICRPKTYNISKGTHDYKAQMWGSFGSCSPGAAAQLV